MITYEDFKKEWLGKGCNPYGDKYGNQCVCVFVAYNVEVMGGTTLNGNAIDYWTKYPTDLYEEITNNPADANQMPQQGDVVIFHVGTYGHIGICDSADVNQVTCLEQNWSQAGTPNDGKGVVELRSHNYILIKGWLHPKNNMILTPDQQNIINFLTTQNANEGLVRQAFGALHDQPSYLSQIQSLQAQVSTLTSQLADLQAQLTTANTTIKSLQDQIATLISTPPQPVPIPPTPQPSPQPISWWQKLLNLFIKQ